MNIGTLLPIGVMTIVMVGAVLGVYYLSLTNELLEGNRKLLTDEIKSETIRNENQVAYNDQLLINMLKNQNLTIQNQQLIKTNQELIKMNQELIKNTTTSNLNLTRHNKLMLDDTNEDVNKLMTLFNQTSGHISELNP